MPVTKITYHSVYPLDNGYQEVKHNFLQCFSGMLYNDPEESLGGEGKNKLYRVLDNVTKPIDCIKSCHSYKYEFAFINLLRKDAANEDEK